MVSLFNDIKPLKDYIGDKKEMIEVMFSCIEENQLRKMIPDALKEVKLDEIKAECLVELLGMSKKRIMGILEGKELDESSEDSLELSDISEDETNIKMERESPEPFSRKESKSKGGRKHKSSTCDSEPEDDSPLRKAKKSKKKVEELPAKEPPPKKAKSHGGKKNKGETNKERKEDESLDVDLNLPEETEDGKGGKNLLEILELEMRARAIRSLIEREDKKNKETAKEGKPSSSTAVQSGPVSMEDDPDAVIIVDEAADQIDLTKDESDSEENPKNKATAPTERSTHPRIYRTNFDKSPESSQSVDSGKTSFKEMKKTNKNLSEGTSNQSGKDKTSESFVPRNWTERWLDSNDVKKVMKTTKVLTNLKKRLISVNKQKSKGEKNSEETNKEPVIIEGTVDEYALLNKLPQINDKACIDQSEKKADQIDMITDQNDKTSDSSNMNTDQSDKQAGQSDKQADQSDKQADQSEKKINEIVKKSEGSPVASPVASVEISISNDTTNQDIQHENLSVEHNESKDSSSPFDKHEKEKSDERQPAVSPLQLEQNQ